MRRMTEAAKAVEKAQRLLLNFLQRGSSSDDDTTDQMLQIFTQPELIKEMRTAGNDGMARRKPNGVSVANRQPQVTVFVPLPAKCNKFG